MPDQRHRLIDLTIVGGFLDGQTFTFDGRLNAVIGARGTGKTTVLELVRWAMDALPAEAAARRRVEDLVDRNLGGGRIDLRVRTAAGLTYTVSRSPGEDPIVTTADGTVTGIQIRGGLFRLDVFSQNEVETIADDPGSQLGLIDAFESDRLAELEREIDATIRQLQAGAARLKPLRAESDRLAEELKGLPAVEEKLKAFGEEGGQDADEVNRAHALKALRDRESRAVERSKELVDELGTATRSLVGRMDKGIESLGLDELVAGPNGSEFDPLRDEMADAARAVDAAFDRAVERLRDAWGRVTEVEERLDLAHREQEVAFQGLMEQHKEAQGRAGERAKLERLRNALTGSRRDLDRVRGEVETLDAERRDGLDRLSELRDRRFALRKAIAERITAEVAPSVRVQVAQYGSCDDYRTLIEEYLRGAGVRHGQVAEKLTSSLSPAELVAAARDRDRQPLRDRAGLNDNQVARLLESLEDEDRLAALETVELSDRPTIELNDNGTWKATAVLSTGQKCTAILPILLIERDGPLLVDQPEDNLDNRFVYEAVVESVRRVKRSRQLIFITHNPNIPVLGEAERVFVMESDGLQGRLRSTGDVDSCKEDIVTLLEGGEDAFRRRHDRYAFAGDRSEAEVAV